MKIIVEVDGGIVTAVWTDAPEPVECDVLDHDMVKQREEADSYSKMVQAELDAQRNALRAVW